VKLFCLVNALKVGFGGLDLEEQLYL
jgi:hypothetical protein